MDTQIFQVASQLGDLLQENHLTFGTAESCTGGGIGAAVTAVSGSSAWFMGGIISYDNRIKMNLLGVAEEDLMTFGAVSEAVAEEMVRGAQRVLQVKTAVAVTGVAGPDGGSEDKPVGTVYIASALAHEVQVKRYQFDGDREHVRQQTAYMALSQLTQQLVD